MENVLSSFEITLRLVVAIAAGAVLGANRDLEGKPAGMRTLGLVSLAAATIAVGTLYMANVQADPASASRVLQGVIQGIFTGIGFLGAGIVMRREPRGEVHGLTTAANILVVAALGVASGLGSWKLVAIGTACALILLVVLQPVEKFMERKQKESRRANDATPTDGST